MKKIINMLKQIWRLAVPYWLKSEERVGSWLLLLASLSIMILTVAASVRMNTWYLDWTNAYVDVNYPLWKQQLWVFLTVGIVMTFGAGFRNYIDQWIAIRWRRWMTSEFIDNWMEDFNYYRMQFTKSTDNPDQRISEDVKVFLDYTWMFTFNLLQQVLTLGSFLVILWNLSNNIPLMLFGKDWSFPGYFIVIALLWAALGTFLSHTFGKALIGLNYNQTRYEADFRFSLVRVRENSEQIALLGGENVEHSQLMSIFNNVIANNFRIMLRRMKLSIVSVGFDMADGVVISVLLGPSYFMGAIPGGYGAIMQISQAFSTVLTTFKFFKQIYEQLAHWKAVINRLCGFLDSREEAAEITRQSRIEIEEQDTEEIQVPQMDIFLPNGQLQVTAKDMAFKKGEKVLIKGKTGAGKTTLFRVISGIWPFGKGKVIVPKDKKVIVLPQRPYLPIGTLAEVISYPEPPEKYSREEMEQVLRDVDLGQFVDRLDEEAHWYRVFSGGEQQRVGIARAMLYKPDYLFFDEATASMDEPSEEVLYKILLERMQDTTIISIGHRSSLEKFHERLIVAEPQPSGSFMFVDSGRDETPPAGDEAASQSRA
ncbi:MAG: ABC transporter ATP-binding protein/permease [Firmicutes bacterium]|nr:ABC transporter ATP-binding protein/permease [Bacillota bacterium]